VIVNFPIKDSVVETGGKESD